MQELLEPVQSLPVCEDRLGDARPVGTAVGSEDALSELRDDRVAHVVVARQEVVDDRVARDRGGAMRPKRVERSGLAGADSAGDRDRDRPGHSFVSGSGSARRRPRAPRC